MRLLIGAYTQEMPWVIGRAAGIYHAEISVTGQLRLISIVEGPRNPTFIVVSPTKKHFYCVQETVVTDDPRAFAFELSDRAIIPLGSVAARGGLPCHISTDASGRSIFLSNYETGTLVSFGLDRKGAFIDAPVVIRHEGSGPNPIHQTRPRVHSAIADPSGRYLLACDLGTDTLISYPLFGGALGTQPAYVTRCHPGSGPRHLEFGQRKNTVFVVNEISSTVAAFAFAEGQLSELGYVSTLPEEWRAWQAVRTIAARPRFRNHAFLHKWGALAATIAVHPNGRFLYVSNRGHDSVAAFEIEQTGRLRSLGWYSSGGKTPRHIRIDPSGQFLLVANQDSNCVKVFSVNPNSGVLSSTRYKLHVPSPACITFLS